MRKAGKASGQAFTEAMGQNFASERDLDTFLDYRFKSLGCEEAAYVPVIAGGKVRYTCGSLKSIAKQLHRTLCKYITSVTTLNCSKWHASFPNRMTNF